MGLDMTSFQAALKEYYSDQLESLVYSRFPLLGMIPKKTDVGGEFYSHTVRHSDNNARSATFERAQTRSAVTSSQYKQFQVPLVDDYAVALISNKLIQSSKNDSQALLRAATAEIDASINSVSRSLAWSLYGNQYGTIGVVSSISTDTITLTQASDATSFEVGQELVLVSTLGSAAEALAGSDGLIVTAVDREAGTITCSANITTTIPTAGAADFIIPRGDYSTAGNLRMAGLAAWCPDTAPTSGDSFYNVDRSSDSRLFGLRKAAGGASKEDTIIDASELLVRSGGVASHLFVSTSVHRDLVKELGSKRTSVQEHDSTGRFGYKAIELESEFGPLKIVSDFNCPANRSYMVNLEDLCLISANPAPHIFEEDGTKMLRATSSDGLEVRVNSYANLVVHKPINTLVIKWDE